MAHDPNEETNRKPAYYHAYADDLMRVMAGLNALMNSDELAGMRVREIRIKGPKETPGSFLVVLKAIVDGEAFVAFLNVDNVEEALRGAVNHARNRSLKWKTDAWPPAGSG